MEQATFELGDFLPFLLIEAAEEAANEFRLILRDRFGMLPTEWRLVFNLGCHGPLTARDICELARVHKTKVSRAVTALEAKNLVTRRPDDKDKRREWLALTDEGQTAYLQLVEVARTSEARFLDSRPGVEPDRLKADLRHLARMRDD